MQSRIQEQKRIKGSSFYTPLPPKVFSMRRLQLCLTLSFCLSQGHAFLPSVRAQQQRSGLTDRRMAAADTDYYVMVNGMPGPMATAAAEACLRKGLQLSPVAMTGPEIEPATLHWPPNVHLRFIGSPRRRARELQLHSDNPFQGGH